MRLIPQMPLPPEMYHSPFPLRMLKFERDLQKQVQALFGQVLAVICK